MNKTFTLSEKTMFMGIGAQKTGTTWLFEYLKSHPAVYVSQEKEMHIFDYRFNKLQSPFLNKEKFQNIVEKRLNNFVRRLKERNIDSTTYVRTLRMIEKLSMLDHLDFYMEYFQKRVRGEKVFGEITPAYSLLPVEGFKEILSLHNKVKFIFILRDPIDRAWSHLQMGLHGKGIKISREEKLKRVFSNDLENNKFYIKSNYIRTITNMEAVVSKENILYLFYEDLFSEVTMKKVCDFLGVDYYVPDFNTAVRKGHYDDNIHPEDITQENIYSGIYEFCHDYFGQEIPSVWKG